jgi:hypothetical protein
VTCACIPPREGPDPRSKGSCVRCGKLIDQEALSTDETHAQFTGRLRSCFPGPPPTGFDDFCQTALERARGGREEFGHSHLDRDNCMEAEDEATDLLNYMHFDVLKAEREGYGEQDIDLALSTAFYAWKAFESARKLAAKRRGSP